MPKPQPRDPGHRIDPSHHGDGRAVHPPTSRDGHPLNHKPLQDAHGRTIAPDRDRASRMDRADFHRNIRGVQDHWDARDHGYDWHDWNGWNVCHHYDELGFHWWGFYVGDVYFWTRYYNDAYWWWDPYWHRWVYLHDGQWWWQDADDTLYLYVDGVYYRYDRGDGGVIMTPDPTPPVDVPPGDPAPVNQTSVYSLDGTRSVHITGDNKDAFLYDLTVADPNDLAAQGKWLASGIGAASFVNDDSGAVGRIVLTATDDSGAETTSTFDRDGNPLDPQPFAAKTLQGRMLGSAAFQALKSGFSW